MTTQTASMKAFAVESYKPVGQLEHFKEVTVPKPSSPGGKDILVKVKAVATNPIDYKRLGNLGNTDAPYEVDGPLIVGWDATGTVDAVGPETILFKVGDEVMFAGDFFRAGAFAEYVLVDERLVGTKPTNLTWSEAAALPLTSLTAWEAMEDQLKIDRKTSSGKNILITAGAGGVGSVAIQIAKKVFGLNVIATASRPETERFVKERGADQVVSHRAAYKPQLTKLGIEQVDYVLHCSDLTPDLFTEFVHIVKPFGGIAAIWPSATVDLMGLFWKSINFSVELMFTRAKTGYKMERHHEILNEVSSMIETGSLTTHQTESTALTAENLRRALEKQASGKAYGKITLAF